MPRLLVVHHSPSPRVRGIADSVLRGARHEDIAGVEVVERAALEATADDVRAADGIVLGTTANFGYISGALKHFFDTTYYQVREETAKLPFSYWIHGGYDTTGAEQAMISITTGYGWMLAAEPLVFTGEVTESHLVRAAELGATVSATVSLGG
ncbi:MAG: NAD(P)H-dependent oxidoreductase [Microbacterium sp.]